MKEKKFSKTYLDEGDILCDRCNRKARRDDVIEIRDPTSSLVLHEHRKRCEDADK